MKTLSANAKRNLDPSRTTRTRKAFSAELRARFDLIRSLIVDAVVTQDALGLTPQTFLVTNRKKDLGLGKKATPKQFAFPSDSDKIAAFNKWLKEQINAGVLSTATRSTGKWTDTYIDSAYKQGIVQSRVAMAKAGIEGAGAAASAGTAGTIALMSPIHIERVKLVALRTFEDLEGITDVMARQISRELSQGLAEGKSPREIARSLAGRVDKIGKTRAETLARTEVIHAHAEGTLTEFEQFGVAGVDMGVEFHTAGDPCPECAAKRDSIGILKPSEARGIIPVHPRCRCVWLPALVGESEDERNIVGKRKAA